MSYRRQIIFLFFLIFWSYIKAQNPIVKEIDSFIKSGNTKNAIYLLQKTYEKAQKRKDTVALLKIYDLYYELYKDNNPQNSKKFLSAKISILINYSGFSKNQNYKSELILTYFKLATVYEKLNDYYFAINTYNTILNKFPEFKNTDEIYYKVAFNYFKLKDYSNALKFINIININANSISDTSALVKSILLRGQIFHKNYFYSQAINDILTSYFIASISNQKSLEIESISKIAEIFMEIEIYPLAIKYYKKILKYSEIEKQDKLEGYINLSKAFYRSKQYDSSVFYSLLALEIALKFNKTKEISCIYNILGQVYVEQKKFDIAREYISKAILISNKSKDTSENIYAYFSYALLNYKLKNYSQTVFYLNKALPIAQNMGNIHLLKQIYSILFKTNFENNNYLKSVYYSDLYNILNDTLTNIYKNIAINKIEAENTLKNQSFSYENKLNSLKRQHNRLIILSIFLVLSLILILMLLFSYFRKMKQLEYTKQKVLQQNETMQNQFEKIKLLSLVANNSTNSIFILNNNWKVIWINEVLLKLYNTSKERIFEEKNADFEQLTKGNFLEIKQVCEQNKSFVYTSSSIQEQKTIWVQTSISPIIEDGKIAYYIGIENDITEIIEAQKEIENQKQAIEFNSRLLEVYNRELKEQKEEIVAQNEELRQQQEELIIKNELLEQYNIELKRLSIATSQTDNMIYFFDTQGNILWVNNSFVKYTGFTLEELIAQKGSNIHDISSIPDIDYYFYLCIEQKRPVNYISEFTTKFGKKIWLQTTLTPIRNDDGNVVEVVGIDSDITETKKAQIKISEQNLEIKKSLEYAQRIQKSVLPMPIFIDSIFEKYFIFYKPRDIVSGDFYHVSFNGNKALITIADCTGHGIPGALMSILGSLAIQNTIASVGFENLPNFFENLNSNVNQILHKYSSTNSSIDSIDLAACSVDLKNKTLEYIGANIPLYIYKSSNQRLNRIKPSKSSIGTFSFDSNQLTVHNFRFDKGDRFFMATDGFIDQFGGRENKRLKRQGFTELMEQLNKDEFANFSQNLDNFLSQWMGNNEQIDDILVFGIEI